MFTVSRTDVVLKGHNCRKLSDRRHLCNSLLLTQISYVYVCMYVRMYVVCTYAYVCICMYVLMYVCMRVMYFRSKYLQSNPKPFVQ